MTRIAVSIYDLPPIETGGSTARQGFAFQDHVAIDFCLELLTNGQLQEVWLETQDDITLLWKSDSALLVEFIQVKSTQLDQLWSLSKLYTADNAGLSVMERSLEYDRCSEPTLFRLVTAIPFNSELSVLTLDRDCSARRAQQNQINELIGRLPRRLEKIRSANGATCKDWLNRSLLNCHDSESAVRDHNLLKLTKVLETNGTPPLQGQLQELYAHILGKVSDMSKLSATTHRESKRFTAATFGDFLGASVNTLFGIPSPTGGRKLREKMEKANLPIDTILQAQEQRRFYRSRSLTPRYLEIGDEPTLSEEVLALLNQVRSQLDAGALTDDGPSFHARCLQELSNYRNTHPPRQRPSLADLQGCMYNITDRCLHRFQRVTA
ncbi:MAG TPA: dsDNA nuclease domain-containing protein [Chthoniobacterales bacterium]|nr:dsDNA nuclease domain-containing protein [Chthoniobacterales bacterium]